MLSRRQAHTAVAAAAVPIPAMAFTRFQALDAVDRTQRAWNAAFSSMPASDPVVIENAPKIIAQVLGVAHV